MDADKGGQRRRRRGPTLADVARRAGVSEATVSYVLNGRPGVSEGRRLEVLRAARELGFRPNRVAQALRGGASRVFGVLLGELSNPAYWDFSASVIETAAEHDYQVLLAYAGDVAKQDQVHTLLAHQVDGLIVTTAVEDDRPLLHELSLREVPFAEGEATQPSGYTMARAMLRRPSRRPTALACANDLIALGAIDAAWDAGLAVPAGVAITGFDDVSLAAARPIQLTSVQVPRLEVGRVAIHLLLERLADRELPPRRIVLPHRVMVRASTTG